MTAPTELADALTEAIDARWEGADWDPMAGPDTIEGNLGDIIGSGMAAPLVDSAERTLEVSGGSAWEPLKLDVGPDSFWIDLRPTQAVRLMQLVVEAKERAIERCHRAIVEELVAAGMRFAAEHPDAPRAKVLVEA